MALVLFGMVVLYLPMFIDFGEKFWWNEEDSHAGILLLGILFAYYRERHHSRAQATSAEFAAGCLFVGLGLAIYALGRIAIFFQLQGISLPIMILGLTLASAGRRTAGRLALINTLLIFTVPLFGALADTVLVPLRVHLTAVAAHFASALGYLAASSGVIVTVGFVELNIAGACVGLRSMVSLLAIGLLSLHFFPMRSFRRALLFALLLPALALAANFLRIVLLIIVAGEWGASAEAQVHDTAAYLEAFVAIGLFVALARLLQPREAA